MVVLEQFDKRAARVDFIYRIVGVGVMALVGIVIVAFLLWFRFAARAQRGPADDTIVTLGELVMMATPTIVIGGVAVAGFAVWAALAGMTMRKVVGDAERAVEQLMTDRLGEANVIAHAGKGPDEPAQRPKV